MKSNTINEIAKNMPKDISKKINDAKGTSAKIKELKKVLDSEESSLSKRLDDLVQYGITVGSKQEKEIDEKVQFSSKKPGEIMKELKSKYKNIWDKIVTLFDVYCDSEEEISDDNYNSLVIGLKKLKVNEKDRRALCYLLGGFYPTDEDIKRNNFSSKKSDNDQKVEDAITTYQTDGDISVLLTDDIKESAKGTSPFGDSDLGDVIASGDSVAIQKKITEMSNFSDISTIDFDLRGDDYNHYGFDKNTIRLEWKEEPDYKNLQNLFKKLNLSYEFNKRKYSNKPYTYTVKGDNIKKLINMLYEDPYLMNAEKNFSYKSSFNKYLKEYASDCCERGLPDDYDTFIITCKEDGFNKVTHADYNTYCEYYDSYRLSEGFAENTLESSLKKLDNFSSPFMEQQIRELLKQRRDLMNERKKLSHNKKSDIDKIIAISNELSKISTKLSDLDKAGYKIPIGKNFGAKEDLADADKRLAELGSDKEKKYQEDRKKLAENYLKDAKQDTITKTETTEQKSGLMEGIKNIGSALGFSQSLEYINKLSKKYNK